MVFVALKKLKRTITFFRMHQTNRKKIGKKSRLNNIKVAAILLCVTSGLLLPYELDTCPIKGCISQCTRPFSTESHNSSAVWRLTIYHGDNYTSQWTKVLFPLHYLHDGVNESVSILCTDEIHWHNQQYGNCHTHHVSSMKRKCCIVHFHLALYMYVSSLQCHFQKHKHGYR